MKVNRLLFKLFVILTIFSTAIFARGEISGALKGGEKIVIKPQNDHALSITRSKRAFSSNASYNVTLVNRGDIIYEDKNLVDDIYLVFHDDVLADDRMKIYVNRGYFDYKITPLLSLPTIVKNVLEPKVLEKAKKHKIRKKKQQKKVALKKVAPAPVIEELREEVLPEKEESRAIAVPKLEGDISYKSPIGKSFFEKFTKIFEELVQSLSLRSISTKDAVLTSKDTLKKPLTSKVTLPDFNDDALKAASTSAKSSFTNTQKGINTRFDDAALRRSATVEKSAFSTPQRGLSENFDDSALLERARVSKRVFNKPQEIAAVEKELPAGIEKKFSGVRSREPMLYQETLTKQKAQVPLFTSPVIAPTPIVNTKHNIEQVVLKEDKAPKVIPVNQYVPAVENGQATFTDTTESYPDTGYKEGYQALEQTPRQVVQKPVRQRVVEDTSLPQASTVSRDDSEERLVITKIIDKQKPEADPFAGRVLGHMDDRVLGNGYNGATSSAKLGMRVTKNSRPVSAWVEVFKNGTKQRVKTFYTSKGTKSKSVKLPAGNYMVRATYRTRDTKQQKTIKNIRLKEGDNVNKSIAFHDGKLRVVARRGDRPMYVKVVAYKSGSRQRVGYDFSSRTSGVAELSLSSGTYDIEVIDHENNRAFDSIRIRAGKTNTINADF